MQSNGPQGPAVSNAKTAVGVAKCGPVESYCCMSYTPTHLMLSLPQIRSVTALKIILTLTLFNAITEA